jgi:predicted Zn-dependent protease with MMP-like domain
MVADALDDLPDELLPVLDNVVVQVVDRNPDEPDAARSLRRRAAHRTQRSPRGPTSCRSTDSTVRRCATDLDELAEEVYVTVIHEVAHAAGIDDDRLHELGWG